VPRGGSESQADATLADRRFKLRCAAGLGYAGLLVGSSRRIEWEDFQSSALPTEQLSYLAVAKSTTWSS